MTATPQDDEVPLAGHWPVDPQEDQPLSAQRIWIDGCFDFVHHGHTGAMLQAKQLGTELLVGIHSDEAILKNKGPTVMTLDERIAAVDACRWTDRAIPHAPYVTQLPWVTHYGCKFVVHGDDITTDSNGHDTYRYVKEAGRYLEVKRTPGISTTDLVGRMLLFSKGHFIRDFVATLAGDEGSLPGSNTERTETAKQMRDRLRDYATDASGVRPYVQVYCWSADDENTKELVNGNPPEKDQRVIYVDGSFDLFSSGHIEFLKQVIHIEEDLAKQKGWYSSETTSQRIAQTGHDYSPAYLVVGLHDDQTVNQEKGSNYPIMNIYERALCTLQCKYVHGVILNAPWRPTRAYLTSLPFGPLSALYHGPTTIPSSSSSSPNNDASVTTSPNPMEDQQQTHSESAKSIYAAAQDLGIYTRIPEHRYADVNAAQIVQRILKNRALYEERQRKKGWKKETEEALLRREREEKGK